ncbi:hypothetical protein BKA57DRAFT_524772 [Linnemannia elongata]|nr:hypothetical protein BKA57DRAFT_524772 [Linnemannia elongata]
MVTYSVRMVACQGSDTGILSKAQFNKLEQESVDVEERQPLYLPVAATDASQARRRYVRLVASVTGGDKIQFSLDKNQKDEQDMAEEIKQKVRSKITKSPQFSDCPSSTVTMNKEDRQGNINKTTKSNDNSKDANINLNSTGSVATEHIEWPLKKIAVRTKITMPGFANDFGFYSEQDAHSAFSNLFLSTNLLEATRLRLQEKIQTDHQDAHPEDEGGQASDLAHSDDSLDLEEIDDLVALITSIKHKECDKDPCWHIRSLEPHRQDDEDLPQAMS